MNASAKLAKTQNINSPSGISNTNVKESGATSSNKLKKKRKRVEAVKNKDNVPDSSNAAPNINLKANKKRKRAKKSYIIDKTVTATDQPDLQPEAKKKTQIIYPKEINQFSSNWRTLLLTMETPKLKNSNSLKKRKTPDKPKKVASSPKFFKVSNEQAIRVKTTANLQTASGSSKPKEIWFDDVDPELLETNVKTTHKTSSNIVTKKENYLIKPGTTSSGLTKTIAMDCEMVGTGEDGKDSILARVSLVNLMGHCVYDKFVAPTEEVTDYRTPVSGVRASDLEKGEEFSIVQKEVSDLISGRLLVGHAVYNDLKVLFLSHPKSKTRDTATYRPFRQLFGGANPSLKRLAEKLLNVKIQEGEHSSVQDAQVAMRLYTMFKKKWETDIKLHRHVSKPGGGKKNPSKQVPNSPGVLKLSQLKI